MLKASVFSLLFLNVVYFLWARGVAPEAEVPVHTAAPTLKLASEVPGLLNKRGASSEALRADSADGIALHDGGEAPSDDMSATLLTNVKRCVSVGPFRDVAEAARAASTLRSSGHEPRQRVAEGEVSAGVWVYLPRPDSAAGSEHVFSALKKAGIDDALEMPGPNEAPVISLGLFSEPKRAETRVARAQALGLRPIVADRKRSAEVYWVDVDLKPTDGLINPADLHPDPGRIVRLEVKACPALAATP